MKEKLKNFSFTSHFKIFALISALLVSVGIVGLILTACGVQNVFNFDIDFIGGTTMSFDLHQSVDKNTTDDVEALFREVTGTMPSSVITSGEQSVTVKSLELNDQQRLDVVDAMTEKYGLSKSPSSWEMEQLSFYKSGHELQGADLGLYGVKDFGTLPETPTYREFEKNGEVYKTPENVCAMAGTVVGSDNVKHIVNLLTPWGVVNVKMYAEMYNKYKAKISVVDPGTGKKKVLDESWFKRGTMLLVYGYRREDTFVAKNVKVNGYQRSVVLINGKGDGGRLDLRFSRN